MALVQETHANKGMVIICGGAPPLGTLKTNDIDSPYRILVPYKFKWREKVGKFTCDCTMCEEWYQPWYGVTWLHNKDCALMKQVRPMETRFGFIDVGVIAQTE